MTSKRKTANPKADAITTERNEATRKATAALTVDGVVKKVTDVNLAISKQFGEITQQLAGAVQEFQTVTKAVELEKEELSRIHDIGLLAKSIDEMEADAANRQAELELANRQFAESLARARISAQEQHDRAIGDMKLAESRAQADFIYVFEQSKREARNKFSEEMRVVGIQERDRHETLLKEWADREEVLKKNEVAFAEAQKQVAEFPAILKAEVAKETAIVTNVMKRNAEHELALVRKDAEAAARIAEMTIKSQLNVIEQLQTQLASAQTRIAAADTKVAEIATKALESTSGQSALSALQSSIAQQNSNGAGRKT